MREIREALILDGEAEVIARYASLQAALSSAARYKKLTIQRRATWGSRLKRDINKREETQRADGKSAHHAGPWSPSEVAYLRQLYLGGASMRDLCSTFRRPYDSVYKRIVQERLPQERDRQRRRDILSPEKIRQAERELGISLDELEF